MLTFRALALDDTNPFELEARSCPSRPVKGDADCEQFESVPGRYLRCCCRMSPIPRISMSIVVLCVGIHKHFFLFWHGIRYEPTL